MKRSRVGSFVVVVAALLLASFSVWGMNTPLGKAVPRTGGSALNGTALQLETTVFSGDSLATRIDGLAVVLLAQGDQVHLGPDTAVTFSGDAQQVLVALERGMTLARSGNGQQVAVNARGLLVRPLGQASYEVAIEGNAVLVASRHGDLDVQGTNRSFVVPSGKIMKFELSTDTSSAADVGRGASNMSPGVAAAVAIAISAGVSIPVGWAIADDLADEARDDAIAEAEALADAAAQQACIDAINSISPGADTSQCN